MKIPIIKNYYDDKDIYKEEVLDLKEPLLVVVGRNGEGKSTLLRQIKEYAKEKKIPCFAYDNYHEGGHEAISRAAASMDIESLSINMQSSEGERIYYNFGRVIQKIGGFLTHKVFNKEKKCLILLDALDSGLDVEGIQQIKDIFQVILKDCKKNNVKTHILITANNYGLVHKMPCLRARDFTRITFSCYEEYEAFIKDIYKEDNKN